MGYGEVEAEAQAVGDVWVFLVQTSGAEKTLPAVGMVWRERFSGPRREGSLVRWD